MLQSYSFYEILFFSILIIMALMIDLLAHRKTKAISFKNALSWSLFWVLLSFGFAGYVIYGHGFEAGTLFISGYLLEKSLSVDNLFVFMAIFASFGIKDEFQHRVLYYGIIGALILRLIFIALGTTFIAVFGKWALLAFAFFLFYIAFKMWQGCHCEEKEENYQNKWLIKKISKIIPVTKKLHGNKFFCKIDGKLFITPLFLTLVTIELADVIFAIDSVPAVIAITKEPFLVYTSNIFAILGLRSMYFLLAAAKNCLCHLETAVIAILVFIGLKMILDVSHIIDITPLSSLIIVFSLLSLGVIFSFICPKK